jgi:hypothetical protein
MPLSHKFLQGECKLIATAPVEYETKVLTDTELMREERKGMLHAACCRDINLMETRLCDMRPEKQRE